MKPDNCESWGDWISGATTRLAEAHLLRELTSHEPVDGLHVRGPRGELTLFCSNDYLGLSSHPAVVEAAREVLRNYGNGPRSSPLVCGYTTLHAALEEDIADLKGTESALLFPTGFAANLGVLGTLGTPGTAIFSDELNHASIIDGCRLAQKNGATLSVYPHGDVAALSAMVERSRAPRKVIVTDSVFSMDGDFAPLPEIVALAKSVDALTVIDEAHATLVHGEHGGGVAEQLGVAAEIDVHVGTLSKAFGSQGGFVATSSALRTLLLNRGRAYVFSTALPLPGVSAARAAAKVASSGEARQRLFSNLEAVGEALGRELSSPIVAVILGSERDALMAAERLLEEGFVIPAIRPPTVPPGTSRLRITVSAGHQPEEIERLCDCLQTVIRRR